MMNKHFKEIEPGVYVATEKHPITKVWALNEKYPDFATCVRFDNVSEPSHDIEECKVLLREKLKKAFDLFSKEITDKIYEAEEVGDEKSRKEMLLKRKKSRDVVCSDLSLIDNLEDLVSLIPEDLKPYWK
jgi:hypothetical protein